MLNTTGCLALIKPSKVESYTSQVKATTETDKENKSDITVSYDYDHYKPSKKKGVNQQGYVQKTANTVSDIELTKLFKKLDSFSNTEASVVHTNILLFVSAGYITNTEAEAIYNMFKEASAISYNCENSLYNDNLEKQKAIEAFNNKLDNEYSDIFRNLVNISKDTQYENFATELNNAERNVSTYIKQFSK